MDIQPKSLTLPALETELCKLSAQINAATYQWLILLAEFDRRRGWATNGMKSAAHWLNWKCGITLSAARGQLRVANRLSVLPLISKSFGQGKLSFSKVRAMVRVATPENEDYLLMIAEHGTASHLEALVRGYRGVIRNDETLEEARESYRDRSLCWHFDDDGSLIIRGRLDPEQGQALVQAIETSVDTINKERESVTAVTHDHFAAQRADGLCRLVEPANPDISKQTSGADRCQVVVHLDEAVLNMPESDGRCELDHGPAVAPETARRLCCDASVVKVVEDEDGNPLSVGRKTRTIPPALRRALRLRDKGCRFPGCTTRHHVDAHHIEHWADGGETAMENLVTLCRHHHRLVHEEEFRVARSAEGQLSFYTPRGNRIPESIESLSSNLRGFIDKSVMPVECRWQGETMDLGLAVHGIVSLEK